MQDEEKSIVNASDFPDGSEQSIPLDEITVSDSTSTSSEDKTSNSLESKTKISAIRTSLYEIAKEEEEEAVSLRVAWQIKQVKERKEHPEEFASSTKTPNKSKHKVSSKKQRQRIGIFPRHGDSGGEVVRKCIFLFSMVVFLACLVLLALYLIDNYRASNLYENLGASYHARQPERITEASETTQVSNDSEEKVYSLLPGVDELLAINEEVTGWISIPDTEVDYPLMQHLDDSEGDEYYLYRNIEGDDYNSGSIFLDYRCSFDSISEDGTLEIPNSDNLIIYGHNMRDGSMFGSLKYYRADVDYYEAHPIIELNSNYETYQYKIFAYFIADAEDITDTRFEYWNAINFADETEFYDYVNEVKRRTLRITNVDVEYGDSLLTLSTCSSVFDTARLVIVARLVRDGEDPYDRVVGSVENPNIKWPTVYYLWHENTYDPDAPFVPYG